MGRRAILSAFVASVGAVALSSTAFADDAGDVKKLVKDEIKAYMDKKKEDDAKAGVFKASWKDGLAFETSDKKFRLKIGGRLHIHNVIGDVPPGIEAFDIPGPGSAIGEFEDTVFFRRARIDIQGEIHSHVKYRLQVDFAGGDADFKDAYIGIFDLKECWGCWAPDVTVGQFREPFSFEEMSPTNQQPLVERSVMEALVPTRNIGVMLSDHFWQDRATFAVGVFATDAETAGTFDDDEAGIQEWEEGWAATARGTIVPWAKDACHFVHLGAGYSRRDVQDVRFRARPDTGTGPRFVDTGTIDMDGAIDLFNAEAAIVWGPFSVQGEYTRATLDSPATDDPEFSSWYAMASWFVAGGARTYKFASGIFDKNRVCCNFLENECCCFGALELAARYGTIDLTDGAVTGGELECFTAGLNWYLDTNTRVMLNYVHAVPDHQGLDEEADFFITAVQVWF
jgi:phosphate-selective porin OprO/OprP